MASLRSRAVAWALRHVLRPGVDASRSPEAMRNNFERFASLGRMPKNIVREEIRLAGLAALRFAPAHPNNERAILYLHGGGYVWGSANGFRSLSSRLARSANCAVFSIDYRLAPEHPAPAALEDALSAYRELRKTYAAEKIIVCGDSAGGGLSLALGLALRDQGETQPGGHLLFCPWGDLALQGESVKRNRDYEPLLTRENLALYAEYYAAGTPLDDPSISTVNADFTGMAPIYIQAAGKDLFLDDARCLAQKAREAGVKVKIDVFAEMFHDFQAVPDFSPEGSIAIVLAGAWAKSIVD